MRQIGRRVVLGAMLVGCSQASTAPVGAIRVDATPSLVGVGDTLVVTFTNASTRNVYFRDCFTTERQDGAAWRIAVPLSLPCQTFPAASSIAPGGTVQRRIRVWPGASEVDIGTFRLAYGFGVADTPNAEDLIVRTPVFVVR